jgi:hypothetical protein
METTKIATVIQSHLSDAILEMGSNPRLAQTRLQFCKFLLNLQKREFFEGDRIPDDQLNRIWNSFIND